MVFIYLELINIMGSLFYAQTHTQYVLNKIKITVRLV